MDILFKNPKVIFLYLFIVINLFIRLFFFDSPQVYDCGFYFGYTNDLFQKSELSLAELNIFGHPTFFPVLIIHIFYKISQNLAFSLQLTNWTFLAIGVVYLYKILEKDSVDFFNTRNLLLIAIFLYQPVLLSVFFTFTPDYWTSMMVFPIYFYSVRLSHTGVLLSIFFTNM